MATVTATRPDAQEDSGKMSRVKAAQAIGLNGANCLSKWLASGCRLDRGAPAMPPATIKRIDHLVRRWLGWRGGRDASHEALVAAFEQHLLPAFGHAAVLTKHDVSNQIGFAAYWRFVNWLASAVAPPGTDEMDGMVRL